MNGRQICMQKFLHGACMRAHGSAQMLIINLSSTCSEICSILFLVWSGVARGGIMMEFSIEVDVDKTSTVEETSGRDTCARPI